MVRIYFGGRTPTLQLNKLLDPGWTRSSGITMIPIVAMVGKCAVITRKSYRKNQLRSNAQLRIVTMAEYLLHVTMTLQAIT